MPPPLKKPVQEAAHPCPVQTDATEMQARKWGCQKTMPQQAVGLSYMQGMQPKLPEKCMPM